MRWVVDRKDLLWFGLLALIVGKLILYFPNVPPYSFLMQFVLYASFACCIGLLFWLPALRITRFEGYVLLYGLWVSAVTLQNDYTQVTTWVFNFVVMFTFTQIIHHALRTSEVDILKLLARVFSSYFYINLLLLLLFPDGIWRREDGMGLFLFGGNYNGMGIILLMVMVTNMLYCSRQGRMDRNTKFILLASPLCMLYVGSMTSTVGLLVAVALFLLAGRKICRWAIFGLLCGIVVFNVFVIFFEGDLTGFDLVVYFVENILGKDMTFTHRTDIWANAMELVRSELLLGYGVHDITWTKDNLGFEFAPTTHNLLLAVLLVGGVVLLGVFIICFCWAFKRSARKDNRAAMIAQGGMMAALLLSLTEAPAIIYIFYLMMLMNYSADLADWNGGSIQVGKSRNNGR